MTHVTTVRAQVCFARAEEGGRQHPIFTGYRPQFHFGSPRVGYDGMITLEHAGGVLPGDQCFVRVRFLHPELLQGVLRPGAAFDIQEGLRVVGRGTIVETFSAAETPIAAASVTS